MCSFLNFSHMTAILRVKSYYCFEIGIPHKLCPIAHARGDARVKAAVHRVVWSVFVYITLSMEVGEGGKKVKRKPNYRDEEIVCLIEGISNKKEILMSKLQSVVTNEKREVWREITANVNSLGVAQRTEEDLKKKWKDLKSAVLNSLRDQKRREVDRQADLRHMPTSSWM